MSNAYDSRTGLAALRKTAAESRIFYMDVSARVPSDASISGTPTVTATAYGLVTGASAVTVGTVTVSSNVLKFTLSGGTNLEDYVIKATITLSPTETLVCRGLLQVRDS